MRGKTLKLMQEIAQTINEHENVQDIFTNSPEMKALIEKTFGDKVKVEMVEVAPLGGTVRWLDQRFVDDVLREPRIFRNEMNPYWGLYETK